MYYTLEKTAEVLEMSTGEVNKLREQGKLRAYRDGSSWKFDEEAVKKFLTDMIRNRSKGDDLLAGEDDEEGPTMLADSSTFDSMLDSVEIDDGGLSLAKDEDDGLTLAKDEADDDSFSLADEDDDLQLVDDSTPLTDEHSALAEDPQDADDDMLHLDGDSGLSLIDDVDEANLDGSNISLGDEDDVVLGSGSGSGSGLNLSGDSGLSLMEDEDDFQLSDPISDSASENAGLDLVKEEDSAADDDGIFELADDNEKDVVLTLEEGADSEAATELAIADDSIFDLADDTSAADTTAASASTGESESASVSQMIDVENDPFTTDDDDDLLADTSAPASEPVNSDPFTTTTDSEPANSDPFALPEASTDAFAAPADTSAPADAFGGLDLEKSSSGDSFGGFSDGGFGSDSFTQPASTGSFTESDSVVPIDEGVDVGFSAPAASSTQYTGKDMILLVPCLILLILATIGAWELCRTIWSYQEGVFDFGGPVLEAIAKMVKLI